jgi:ABC-type lipoprotein release transport system permease subunit
MILVVARSFSAGITDILFNKILVRVAGHISVAFNEEGKLYKTIFRDRERMLSLVKNNLSDIREIEEALGIFTRVIGNGKSDNGIIVGIDLSQTLSEETRREIEESFRMMVGDFIDLGNEGIENPVILSEEKAKYLRVGKGDTLRIRFTNIYGNNETARLNVAGIVKNDNIFMQSVIFSELKNVKRLMGFKEYEVANLNITIKKPTKNAVPMADKLHSALEPGLAVIYGKIRFGNIERDATVLGLNSDETSQELIGRHFEIVEGDKDRFFSKDAILISKDLAEKIKIAVGDKFKLVYKNRFEEGDTTLTYKVTGIFVEKSLEGRDIILMSDEKIYHAYYANLPEADVNSYIPKKDNPLYPVFATEWILLDRTGTTEEIQKKIRDISNKKWKGTTVDVRTMYETASDILKLENVLNIITISAVLILFFIILIGVINTLRMTIKERTREIGTIRSIGMQKSDVRNTFLLESLFLGLFASIAGILMAFVAIHMLSKLTFELRDNPLSILLVNGHLYFMPTTADIISILMLILCIVAATAYFPARTAANLSPSAALRYHD